MSNKTIFTRAYIETLSEDEAKRLYHDVQHELSRNRADGNHIGEYDAAALLGFNSNSYVNLKRKLNLNVKRQTVKGPGRDVQTQSNNPLKIEIRAGDKVTTVSGESHAVAEFYRNVMKN